MSLEQFIERDDRMVRRYQYDDRTVIAADIGVNSSDVTIDIVDDTAIVVDDESGQQAEIELPNGGGAKAFIKNGVLSIEVRQ